MNPPPRIPKQLHASMYMGDKTMPPKGYKQVKKSKPNRKQRITRTVLKRTPVWLSLDWTGYEFWDEQPRYEKISNASMWRGKGGPINNGEPDAARFELLYPSLKLDLGQCVRCMKITTDKGFLLERDE